MNINDDIIKAQEIVSRNTSCTRSILFSDYSRVYRATNEIISHKNYIELLKKKRKVFTITASGDQLLNSILFDTRNITCMDITRFAKYYASLKIAALKVLNKLEYLSFFAGRVNMDLLSSKTYEKIRKELDSETLLFWDSLFNYFDDVEINESFLFSNAVMNKEIMTRNNPYLYYDNYEKLQRKIDRANIIFKDGNVYNGINNDNEYDLINLSNIIDYSVDKKEYKEFIENLPLKRRGVVISYMFICCKNYINRQEINKFFRGRNYSIVPIDKDYHTDSILVYKKGR